jgi:hypothetical protein
MHELLDSWSGIGLIVAGMTYQGWDVQLTAYAARDWRANFFPVGIAHSVVGGSAWEPTPWRGRCSGRRGRCRTGNNHGELSAVSMADQSGKSPAPIGVEESSAC